MAMIMLRVSSMKSPSSILKGECEVRIRGCDRDSSHLFGHGSEYFPGLHSMASHVDLPCALSMGLVVQLTRSINLLRYMWSKGVHPSPATLLSSGAEPRLRCLTYLTVADFRKVLRVDLYQIHRTSRYLESLNHSIHLRIIVQTMADADECNSSLLSVSTFLLTCV